MLRTSIVLASLGLALNLMLWSVPGLVAASSAVQFLRPSDPPDLAVRMTLSADTARTPSLQDALIGLVGAEVEAMQVAGVAIENPHTPNLAERADAAGNRVLDAVYAYIRAFRATVRS
jgi:hypothetical protein